MPARILHIISDLHTGGAQSMLYKVVTGMDTRRFKNVAVALTNPGLTGDRLTASGIPVHYLGMRRGIPNPVGLTRLIRLIQQEKPDIIQTWLYHADLIGLSANIITRRPVLLWNVRQSLMDFNKYSRLTRTVVKLLAQLSAFPNAVLVNSMTGLNDHQRLGYHPKRWIYVPNGFDLNAYRPDDMASTRLKTMLGIESETFLIGMFARYDPMKDHETFLKAAVQIANQYPHVHFVLAGPRIEESNLELTNVLSGTARRNNFHFLGDRRDIDKLLPGLDVYTSSSAFGEGFSNSIGEAMACGVPCVVTGVGDSAAIVDKTGMVIPPQDVNALVQSWQVLIQMPHNERRTLGKAARSRMENHYDIRKIVGDYERIYDEFSSGTVSS